MESLQHDIFFDEFDLPRSVLESSDEEDEFQLSPIKNTPSSSSSYWRLQEPIIISEDEEIIIDETKSPISSYSLPQDFFPEAISDPIPYIENFKAWKSSKLSKENTSVNEKYKTADKVGGVYKQGIPIASWSKNRPSLEDPCNPIQINGTNIHVSSVSSKYRAIFPWEHFNDMQSKVFETLYKSDSHTVISSPTASGKTVCFELAMIRCLEQKDFKNLLKKIVYIAPIKALCQERLEDWKSKFQPLGITCCELTGDSEESKLVETTKVSNADIILTTPEKWDSITRNFKDTGHIVNAVDLILIDEVHLLNEDRGATLEAIVSRMKTLLFPKVARIVALSATIPNLNDIGEWIGATSKSVFHFDENYRPVPLDIHVLGYNPSKNDYMFDKSLNYKLVDVIKKYAEGKPAIVFCSSRKGANSSASFLASQLRGTLVKSIEHKKSLEIASKKIKGDKQLSDCILKGIAYHHAGMDRCNRSIVEQLFGQPDGLLVLFSTSTLAQGVNLPAYLVIIKSTSQWRSGVGYVDYDPLSMQQMMGRAGRPQYGGEKACAVIMTKKEDKSKYEKLAKGKSSVESNLHKSIAEHLNAEIVSGSITDVSVALSWMKNSFFYVRAKKNPTHYGLAKTKTLANNLHELCLKNINDLEKYELIRTSSDGLTLEPLELGRIASRFFVAIPTIKLLREMKSTDDTKTILSLLAKAHEFSQVILRRSEKKELNALSKKIRYPINKIKDPYDKVNCLIQASIGRLPIEDFSLKQEAMSIYPSCIRILKCMRQYLVEKKYLAPLYDCIMLGKSLKQKLWDKDGNETVQIEKIGQVYAANLAKAGINSIQELLKTSPRQIEVILNRNPPFGNEVHEHISKIPIYELDVLETRKSEKCITLIVKLSHQNVNPSGFFAQNHYHSVLIGYDNTLLLYRYLKSTSFMPELKVDIPLDDRNKSIDIYMIDEEYIGFDTHKTYYIPPYKPSRGLVAKHVNKKRKVFEYSNEDISMYKEP